MNKPPFLDTLLKQLSDKEEFILYLGKALEESDAYDKKLDNFIDAVKDGKTSNDQLGTMVKGLCIATKHSMTVHKNLLILAMIYFSGGSANTDIAMTLNKFGMGQDALKAMFDAKLKGKG